MLSDLPGHKTEHLEQHCTIKWKCMYKIRQSGSRACGWDQHSAVSQGRSPGSGEGAPERPEWPESQEELVICEQPCGPCQGTGALSSGAL